MIGTVAQMIQVEALDEERYSIVAVGVRRIRVNAWLPDDPYPLADVDDFPDVDPDPPGLALDVAATHARVRAALAMARNSAMSTSMPTRRRSPTTPSWPRTTSRALAPIGPADRYRLLGCRRPDAASGVLDEVLDDVEAMLKFRLS